MAQAFTAQDIKRLAEEGRAKEYASRKEQAAKSQAAKRLKAGRGSVQ